MGWFTKLFRRPDRGDPQARATDDDLAALSEDVRAAYDDGRAARAERRALEARRRFPGDPDVAALVGDLLLDAGEFQLALEAFGDGTRLDPDDPYCRAWSGACRIELGDLDGARADIAEALALNGESPDATWWQGVLYDLEGEERRAERAYGRASRALPAEFRTPYRVPRKRFQRLAEKAFAGLDREYEGFREDLERRNVVLRIQDVPSPEQIASGFNPLWLGVYEGHAGAEVSLEDPWSAMPGIVILFQRNIERGCADLQELEEQIRITLLHEIAHAHGRDEEWMEDRGLQ